MPHAWWSPHLGSALRELPHYAPVANGAIEVITFTRSLRDSLLGNVCQYQRQYWRLNSIIHIFCYAFRDLHDHPYIISHNFPKRLHLFRTRRTFANFNDGNILSDNFRQYSMEVSQTFADFTIISKTLMQNSPYSQDV